MMQLWWIWAAAAIVFGILEILVPANVFLGFAAGAVVVSIVLAAGVTLGLPQLILIFAVASLIAWLILRRALGIRKGQVKTWDRDINED